MRPFTALPAGVKLLLALALLLQLAVHAGRARDAPAPASALPAAPALPLLRVASGGEEVALARLAMLYVGSRDGPATPLASLDYTRLRDWLARILALDPRGQAPLLAASQVYAATSDQVRARLMLDFVHEQFLLDPDRRWPWLAHAALVARHRLHDAPLALHYAQAIRTGTNSARLPPWALQMEVFILDDMNELDSAKALIGALLASGEVSDPRELAFLERRLHSIAARQRQPEP